MNKSIFKYLPYILIAAFLIIAAGFYLDKNNQNSLVVNNVQNSGSAAQNNSNRPVAQNNQSIPKIDFNNLGPAPEFTGIDHWLNTPNPLSIKDLKGKVVLVDFWTYSCINCIRTLPYVTKWYDTYHNQGFVVIGVHTPEFSFEKDTNNVQNAINMFNIHYPVAQDNEYGTWNAYKNEYWPAEYLIDQNGNIVYNDFGEGNYDKMENAIRQLLGMNAQSGLSSGINDQLQKIGSPEMYFGTYRLQYLNPAQQPSPTPIAYKLPSTLDLNTFAMDGTWAFNQDNAFLTSDSGKIKLKFHSAKLYMVAQSSNPAHLKITVDGKAQPDVVVSASKLYTLFDSNDYSDHEVEIDISGAGFEAFTFTFG